MQELPMNRRKFVVVSTVLMLAVAGLVAGLSLYTNFVAKAAIGDLPPAVKYFPADSHAILGVNVRAFVRSPFYARIEAKHGGQVGTDLAEFIEKTGVDPRTDLDYVVAGGRSLAVGKGSGVLIAIGRLNEQTIMAFIKSKCVPIEVKVDDATVYMLPEHSGTELEKGIAFLSQSEVALGDLDSLKAILDVRAHKPGREGIDRNPALAPMLQELDPNAMFWFAGDAANILSKSPVNSPIGEKISAIQSIFGTLNLTDVVSGQITASARDEESATKLADVVKGLVALGQLATEQNAELSVLGDLIKGVQIGQERNRIHLSLSFPAELLDKLEQAKSHTRKVL
jgi:hypothetical protein